MGISILGEAYGNLGKDGAIVFMFGWGFFLACVNFFLFKHSNKNILLLAFIPLIYLQVFKAETELSVVLNHLTKSILVVFMFFWFSRRILGFKIVRN